MRKAFVFLLLVGCSFGCGYMADYVFPENGMLYWACCTYSLLFGGASFLLGISIGGDKLL